MIWGVPEAIKWRKGGEEEDVTRQHESKLERKKKKEGNILNASF